MTNEFGFGEFTPINIGTLLPPPWKNDRDIFHGTFLDDTFSGRSGNDMMWGSAGADTFFGGSGIDTVNYSNAGPTASGGRGQGVYLDLEAGIGTSGLARGDRYSSVENVIGTAFHDRILGSAANNKILSGAGEDDVSVSGGKDFLDGGADQDTLELFRHNDVTLDLLNSRGIGGIADGDTYVNFENLHMTGDRNTAIGDDGDNRITMMGIEYDVEARGGDDLIIVNSLTNGEIDGGAGSDTVEYLSHSNPPGANGPVIFDLARGELRQVGSSSGDPVTTLTGVENAKGTIGDDTFIDSRADNIFEGKEGADTFVFDHDFSGERDVIKDFSTASGDQIDLSQTAVRDYNDLLTPGSRWMEPVGFDTVIHTGNGNQILLEGIAVADLSVDDFII